MILIMVEEGYEDSIWCLNLLEGLSSRLRHKRIPFRQIRGLEEVQRADRYLYLIGSNNLWLEEAVRASNAAGVYPILLCNQADHAFDADYSTVCLDVVNSMRRLVELLERQGHRRIALYGVNPQSVSDEGREKGYLTARRHNADTRGKNDIFFNTGSLENCFEVFFRRRAEYDAVICVNEFAAVSLARRMRQRDPERLGKVPIISCADGWLSQFYQDCILSVRGNFDARAKAAVDLVENLKKNPELSHVIMTVRWDFSMLEGTKQRREPEPQRMPVRQLPRIQDAFYEDPELGEMMLVERLLRESGKTDRRLLWRLLNGDSYAQISESCFLTESAIKYRIRKMVELCRVSGRAQLTALLKKYLPQGISAEGALDPDKEDGAGRGAE